MTSGSWLRPATLETLQTPQRLTSGQPSDYALGWKIETVPLAGQPARLASLTRWQGPGGVSEGEAEQRLEVTLDRLVVREIEPSDVGRRDLK